MIFLTKMNRTFFQAQSIHASRLRYSFTSFRWCMLICLLLPFISGCAFDAKKPDASAPPPAFTGPTFFHRTVGSMTKLKGFEPLLVSGYGIVVNLKGTGSSEVPSTLRRKLVNDMLRKGLGSIQFHTRNLSPSRVLDSENTAVVTVEGLIPSGAVKGTRFDLLVSALPQTQTTSLDHGRLWTTDLAIDGINPALAFSRKQATGKGDTYLSPLSKNIIGKKRYDLSRKVAILSGGVTLRPRQLKLILNQPSWTRSRLIADRINYRFRKERYERQDTAIAKTDLLIELNIPARFTNDTKHFLGLIQHLYVQQEYNFEQQQVSRLADILLVQPTYAERISLAWEALGKTAVPSLKNYYESNNLIVQLAALEAGVQLKDRGTSQYLRHLAGLDDSDLRRQAGVLLAKLPLEPANERTLRRLLSDINEKVRLSTYEALSETASPTLIQRNLIGDKNNFKFILDIVESQRPMIYINQQKLPKIVIFNSYLGFKAPLITSLWDNTLFLKMLETGKPLDVYIAAKEGQPAKTFQIAPTVGNLIFLLGHKPSSRNPAKGLNLSYSHVIDVLYQLSQQRKLQGPFKLQESPLALTILKTRNQQPISSRPETSPTSVPASPAVGVLPPNESGSSPR